MLWAACMASHRKGVCAVASWVNWRDCLYASWQRGLLREKVTEGTGFTNLWGFGFFFQAADFVDCILGGLLVILVSKERMNNNYNNNIVRNELKDLTFIECQHFTVWHWVCTCITE